MLPLPAPACLSDQLPRPRSVSASLAVARSSCALPEARAMRWSCNRFLFATSVTAAWAKISCLAAKADVMPCVSGTRDLKKVIWKPNSRCAASSRPVMYHHSMAKSGWLPRSRGNCSGSLAWACTAQGHSGRLRPTLRHCRRCMPGTAISGCLTRTAPGARSWGWPAPGPGCPVLRSGPCARRSGGWTLRGQSPFRASPPPWCGPPAPGFS